MAPGAACNCAPHDHTLSPLNPRDAGDAGDSAPTCRPAPVRQDLRIEEQVGVEAAANASRVVICAAGSCVSLRALRAVRDSGPALLDLDDTAVESDASGQAIRWGLGSFGSLLSVNRQEQKGGVRLLLDASLLPAREPGTVLPVTITLSDASSTPLAVVRGQFRYRHELLFGYREDTCGGARYEVTWQAEHRDAS